MLEKGNDILAKYGKGFARASMDCIPDWKESCIAIDKHCVDSNVCAAALHRD